MKKILLSLFLLLGMVFSVMAQETYEWTKYRIKATVPEGMTLTKNDSEGLVLKASNFTFGLSPFKNAKKLSKLSDEEMAELVLTFCKQLNMNPQTAESEEFECNNGEGIFVIGPRQDMEGWMSLFAFVGNEDTNKFALVFMSFEEDMGELAGQVLGNIQFY